MANEIVKLTVRIPQEIDKKLKEESEKEMISKNALIIRACRKLIERQGQADIGDMC